MNTYTIGLVESSSPDDGKPFDEFEILSEGRALFNIRYDYWLPEDSTQRESVIRVRQLTEFDASMMPHVMNNVDLAGLLHEFLSERIAESGDEFYADLFYDEDGNHREIPFNYPSQV